MKVNCCYDCPDREIGCHDKCLKYQCYKIHNEKINTAKQEYNENKNRTNRTPGFFARANRANTKWGRDYKCI